MENGIFPIRQMDLVSTAVQAAISADSWAIWMTQEAVYDCKYQDERDDGKI